MALGDLKPKDIEMLSKMVEYAKKGEKDPTKKAIMEVCGYKKGDKSLPQKIYQQKKRLMKDKSVTEIVEIYGITLHRIAQKVDELLDAKKAIYFQGEKVDEVPNSTTQLDATKVAMDLLGLGSSRGKALEVGKQVNNLIVFVESEENARERIEEDKPENELIQKSYQVEEEVSE